jgi:hypothetical protein
MNEKIRAQLNHIEQNASNLSQLNRTNYLYLSKQIKYFKIPVIFFSSLNSIFAVSLNSYMSQPSVSLLNCLISFMVSLISSLELYLGLTKRLDKSLLCYRNFYMLSMKIKQYNFLEKVEEPEKFLQECIEEYESYFKESEVTRYGFHDQLISQHDIHIDHWYETSCFGKQKEIETKTKEIETKTIEMGTNTEKENSVSETAIVICDENVITRAIYHSLS